MIAISSTDSVTVSALSNPGDGSAADKGMKAPLGQASPIEGTCFQLNWRNFRCMIVTIPSDPSADLSDNDGSRRPVRSTSTVGKRRQKGACQTSHKQGMYLILIIVENVAWFQ